MESHIITIPAQIKRGLLAVVFVMSNLFYGGPCCCASLSCGASQDEDHCCTVEATQGCCCCQQPSDDELASSTCCCSKTSQQSSTGCPGTCHCCESPLTEGIVAGPHRIQQEQVQKTWLTDFNQPAHISTSIASVEPRPEQQFPRDPCDHNLRQAILSVWRI
jgi:hypothetical protein